MRCLQTGNDGCVREKKEDKEWRDERRRYDDDGYTVERVTLKEMKKVRRRGR